MARVTCREDLDLLLALTRLTVSERTAVLKVLDTRRIRSVCECAYNLLRGNVPLPTEKKRQLFKYKSALRKLVRKGESWAKKRKYLVQVGGGVFLPLLLSTVLQALIN